MGHLMDNASRTIIIIIRTSRRILRESPVSIIRARNNDIRAGDGVEESRSVSAVAVQVRAVDLWGCGLHVRDVVVDDADGGFLRGGLEPGCEVVGASAGGCVGGFGHGDGVGDGGGEGGSLGGCAGVVCYCSLLDAGGAGILEFGVAL